MGVAKNELLIKNESVSVESNYLNLNKDIKKQILSNTSTSQQAQTCSHMNTRRSSALANHQQTIINSNSNLSNTSSSILLNNDDDLYET